MGHRTSVCRRRRWPRIVYACGRDAKDDAAAEDAGGEYEAEDDEDEFDDLLGLFDGLSIVERANGYDDDIPDVITIFKGPHERCFNSREEIVEEVGKTIIHELGHYFGLNEDQLARHGLRVRGQDSPAPSHATP